MASSTTPTSYSDATRQLSFMKTALDREHAQHWDHHLESLSVQSKFAEVVSLERQSKVWSRIMFGLPAGQLSFLIRAGADVLPTPASLRRWKYRTYPSYPLCRSPSCTVNCFALNQGRYTWRHDAVLHQLVLLLMSHLPVSSTVYADLPGLKAADNPPSTVPASAVVTTARPDIVIASGKQLTLLELTVPANTVQHLDQAGTRKQTKGSYESMVSDLESAGFQASLLTIEIGSLGHQSNTTLPTIRSIIPSMHKSALSKKLLSLSKTAVACSYHIFKARHSLEWGSPP